ATTSNSSPSPGPTSAVTVVPSATLVFVPSQFSGPIGVHVSEINELLSLDSIMSRTSSGVCSTAAPPVASASSVTVEKISSLSSSDRGSSSSSKFRTPVFRSHVDTGASRLTVMSCGCAASGMSSSVPLVETPQVIAPDALAINVTPKQASHIALSPLAELCPENLPSLPPNHKYTPMVAAMTAATIAVPNA